MNRREPWRFFGKVATSFAVSAAIACGLFFGAFVSMRALGFVKPRAHSLEFELVQAQIVEIQDTLECIAQDRAYDGMAANPIDEFEGQEEQAWK